MLAKYLQFKANSDPFDNFGVGETASTANEMTK